MKPISELKLETIQLEDQVLLVDKVGKLSDGDWFYNNFDDHQPKIQQRKGNWTTCFNEFKIIASTKPLEGLPLLVIKDGIKKLATKTLSEQDWDTSKGLPFNEGYLKGFKHGFKKARQTFKFTEEDLRKAFQAGQQWVHDLEFGQEPAHFPEVVESLTKKELWVEIEGYKVNGMIDEATSYKPKIVNNQIKAIWK